MAASSACFCVCRRCRRSSVVSMPPSRGRGVRRRVPQGDRGATGRARFAAVRASHPGRCREHGPVRLTRLSRTPPGPTAGHAVVARCRGGGEADGCDRALSPCRVCLRGGDCQRRDPARCLPAQRLRSFAAGDRRCKLEPHAPRAAPSTRPRVAVAPSKYPRCPEAATAASLLLWHSVPFGLHAVAPRVPSRVLTCVPTAVDATRPVCLQRAGRRRDVQYRRRVPRLLQRLFSRASERPRPRCARAPELPPRCCARSAFRCSRRRQPRASAR